MDFPGFSLGKQVPCHTFHCPKGSPQPWLQGLRDGNDAEGIDGGTVIVTMASQHRLHELHFVLSKLGMSPWWTNKDLIRHGDFG